MSKKDRNEVFDELLVKKRFSIIDEPEQCAKSCQNPDALLSCNKVVFSGFLYSFSTVEFEEGIIYKSSLLDNKTHLTWTHTSSGAIPALHESKSSHQFAAGVNKLTSSVNSRKEHQEKALYLSKILQNSSLPELQSHPVRRLIETQNSYTFGPNNNKFKQPFDNSHIETPDKFKNPKKNPPRIKPKKSSSLPANFSNAYKAGSSKATSIWRCCRFCLKNGEPEQVVASHFTRSANGTVSCPILRRYVCEICGATGSYSHTRKYCPFYNPLAFTDPNYNRIANALMAINLN